MQILLDECVSRRLRREFPGHEVRTVPELGWSGRRNGDLLQLMLESGFPVLITVDQGIRHQQNLEQAGVAVVVLVAGSNRLADLTPLMPQVLSVLQTIKPGEVVMVSA